MPILITAVLLLGTAAALAILRVFRARFRFRWLLGVAATTAAWQSVLLWLPQLPLNLVVPLWQSAGSPNSFPTFMVSSVSWPYAFSLVTTVLAVLLTAPARSDFPSPPSWALCLAVAGLGMLAAAAEGPLTLVLFWAGLDLVEAGVMLARAEIRSSSRQVLFAFTMRLGGMALALLALALGHAAEAATGFGAIQGPGALLLAGAALLRLAALAIPWPISNASTRPDAVGTTLHLAAGASAVAFLSQLRPEAQNDAFPLLAVCACAALYAGWMWLRAPDAFSGRPLWMMGAGSLAVAGALRGNPVSATAWGSAMLLAGCPLFLTAIRERWMNRALLLGLWISSALPFALTSTAWGGGGGALDWMTPVFLIAQSMLLAGFLHRALRPEIDPSAQIGMASLRGIYLFGIGLPLAVGVLLGFWGWPGAFQLGVPFAGVVVVLMVGALTWAKRRFASLNPVSTHWIPPAWNRATAAALREASRVQAGVQRIANAVTRTIEGEAGIMWSLLLLVLFVSLIAGRER